MFSNPFRRQKLVTPEVIKDSIIGYEDIKDFLAQYEESSSDMNIMFHGPPATSKTLFLKYCESRFPNCIYYDCSTSTGRGIINSIVEFKMENKEKNILGKERISTEPLTLLLDEVEKIKPRTDLNMLLNLLEGKSITYTKFGFYVRLTIPKLRVFATANSLQKIPKPFRSRFYVLTMKEYDEKQFTEIGRGLATQYLGINIDETAQDIGEEIAAKLYRADNKDVRQIINAFKVYEIFKGKKTVDEVLQFQNNYKFADLPE